MKSKKKANSPGDDNYVAKDERYNRKQSMKELKSMKTAGIANALKKSQKKMGKAKIPKVKPQRK